MAETHPYERVMAVLNGRKQDIDRLPCINSVGTYTLELMKATGAFWPEAHKDSEKMAKLAAGAHRICGLDNITVPFDLVVEAETLGAPIEFFEGKVRWPSVKQHVAKELSDLKFPSDVSAAGRVPVITKALQLLKKEFEGRVPIIAYVNAPFTSISSYLVDTMSFLMWVKLKPDRVREFYKDTWRLYADIASVYKDAGADIVTFREEGCSTDNLAPSQFDEFVKPYLRELIGAIKPPRILHICGSALKTLDKIVQCEADAITIDERTPMKEAKELAEKITPGYPIGGNVSAFEVVGKGPVERIRDAVKRAVEEGTDLVAPGCDFYLDTPTEHLKAFVDAAVEYGMKR